MEFQRIAFYVRTSILYVLLPLALVSVIVAGTWFFFTRDAPTVITVVPTTTVPADLQVATEQQVFKEVLLAVLAVAGVILTLYLSLLGIGAFRILSERIRIQTALTTEWRLDRAEAKSKLDDGFLYWRLYVRSKRGGSPDRELLDWAIDETREGYELHGAHLDENKHDVERLLMNIRNNWAYYILEKHQEFGTASESEKAMAKSFVDYIRARLPKYPEKATDLTDTVRSVTEGIP